MGLETYVVGETVTPTIWEGDAYRYFCINYVFLA